MVILLKRQVAAKVKVCARTVEIWVRKGTFPPPFYIGKLAAWDKRDVDAWIAQRIAESGGHHEIR